MLTASSTPIDGGKYFAYGSNMSGRQMRERCASAQRIALASVSGYRLAFTRKGSYRPGGVASIVPATDSQSQVFGIIWAISSEDLRQLDSIEDPKAYERIVVLASALDGVEHECFTYVAFPQASHVSPDPEYLELLVGAAEEAGLPNEYIEEIRAFRGT